MIDLSALTNFFERFLKAWNRELQLFGVAVFLLMPTTVHGAELKLSLPVECELGKECFFQNFADLDPGPGVKDPWCGTATYDGHKGTDIRARSLKDMVRNIPVIASATGTVTGVRDGVPDRIVRTQADRLAVNGIECGNGVVIAHGNGYETQYCHLKNGSISVGQGDRVSAGQRLGFIGSSGLSQFPHVHVTLRKDNQWLDLVSGRKSSTVCEAADPLGGFLDTSAIASLPNQPRQLLGIGLAGAPIDHSNLVVEGAPPQAGTTDKATVGWAWVINLSKDDRIAINVKGPAGFSASSTIKPLDRPKASYSVFTGKQRTPVMGDYTIRLEITNAGKVVLSGESTVSIR